ncbi:hypothetical protein M8J76_012614 [Diaphorina citri]|nr:hypothetical protein M8J76_012614 [Diaphorina citri]
MGKTKRRLSRTNKVPLGKKEFEDMFEEWKAAPLKPGLPSDMLSVQSKQLKEHVEFLSTMHYVKTYTEKLTVIDNLWKEESYSDYEKYKRPKLRTQHSMDFDNVVKYRLMKADKLRRNRINTVDSDYIIESMQYYLDDNAKKHTFTFPMGNFKTLYPRYNPFYYNRSVINSDLMVETLKGLTRNRGTLAQFDLEYRKNMTERMRNYLKQNPDKNKDEIDFDDFEDTQEGISHLYYMGMTTMLPEDLPHLNFDYIRNDYTAIDHAVFHWSIIAKKENKLSTIPYKPGESSTTSYLEYYWKTPSTLDWQRYWKYPYSTTTIKPTGPDNKENREFAQNLEKNLDQDARNKILADLEQLDSLMVQNIDTSTSRTLVWHRNGTDCDISTLASKGTPGNVNKGRDQFSQNTINIADIIDPADISRELRRKRRKRNIEDVQSHIKNSDEFPSGLTAKPIEWKIPDSILENIHGTTLPDDIHNTKLAFKYLENCTDSEEYLNITLPNYMRDIYYGFTKCKKPKTTPVIRWSMPKQVLNLIDKGTNPIRLEAEKYIPYSIFRKKIMHIMKMKMKSYSIPFYRKRLDKTPFSLNTEEKDEIYYDSVEKHGLRHRATHNYRMVSYMFPLFSNSCERIIKDMVEGYHNVYDPPAAKRIFLRGQSSSTLKQEEYDDQWIKINPSDLLRFPPPTVYWPTINRNDVTYRPPWIKNSTRITKKKLTTTPFETESFESKDSLVKDDWVFTTEHWNDVNRANITALQIFMDRPSGQSSEFNDYCRKHGLPLDENGDPPPDWYDSQIPPDVDEAWRKVQEHNTFAPFTYSEERLGTHEEHVKKKDVKKFIERLLSNQTVNLAEEDFNETSTIIIKSRAYLSKRFSRERYYKYDAKYLEALKEMNAPKQVKPGYKDPQYKRMEKLYESNKNNKSNIFFSNIYKDGVKPGHELLRSEEEEINRPLSWEYKPNYTHVESNSRDSLENPFADPLTTTTEDPYTFIDLSDLIVTSAEKQSPTLPDIPLDFINGVLAQKSNNPRPPQSNERVFPSTTINPYTCEFIKDLMSSYELRKKNIPKDAIVAHPYGRPQPYYKKVIYDRLGAYIGTTFVSAEHTTYKSSNQ